MDPWKIAEKAVKELPPFLADGELTAERLYRQHTDMLKNIDDARSLLEKLVEAEQLRFEERRTGKGGSPTRVYIAVEKGSK